MILLVELWAMEIGLQLAIKLQVLKLIVERDSRVIYKWLITNDPAISYELRSIWIDIKSYLSCVDDVRFTWSSKKVCK